MRPQLLFVSLFCIDLARSLRISQLDKDESPTAHILFVNLKQEKNRCLCISSQLNAAPFPVTRIDAASPHTQQDRCPELFKDGLALHQKKPMPGQSALYCSNYLAWKHFYHNTKADYAIIFEDDIILHKGFWDRVKGLLASTCDNSPDYMTVDGKMTGKSKKIHIGQSAKCQTKDGQHENLGILNVR